MVIPHPAHLGTPNLPTGSLRQETVFASLFCFVLGVNNLVGHRGIRDAHLTGTSLSRPGTLNYILYISMFTPLPLAHHLLADDLSSALPAHHLLVLSRPASTEF